MTDKGKAWSKQTPEVLEAICEALRLGVPSSRAAKMSGISYKTFCTWRSRGWELIEQADEDSSEALPFEARFAIEVEANLVQFMKPFLARIRAESQGAGKGDWRAARAILEMRFPDEFSEKVHAAKSARLEVSGAIDVNHAHGYQEFLVLRNMTHEELAFEIEKLDSRKNFERLEGEGLDAAIAVAESKLAGMIAARDAGYGFMPCNLNVGNPAIRPAPLPAIDLDETEFSEPPAVPAVGVSGAATIGPAPDTGAAVVLAASVPVAPSSEIARERAQIGIGFDGKTGQAIPIYDGDEDLSL